MTNHEQTSWTTKRNIHTTTITSQQVNTIANDDAVTMASLTSDVSVII